MFIFSIIIQVPNYRNLWPQLSFTIWVPAHPTPVLWFLLDSWYIFLPKRNLNCLIICFRKRESLFCVDSSCNWIYFHVMSHTKLAVFCGMLHDSLGAVSASYTLHELPSTLLRKVIVFWFEKRESPFCVDLSCNWMYFHLMSHTKLAVFCAMLHDSCDAVSAS